MPTMINIKTSRWLYSNHASHLNKKGCRGQWRGQRGLAGGKLQNVIQFAAWIQINILCRMNKLDQRRRHGGSLSFESQQPRWGPPLAAGAPIDLLIDKPAQINTPIGRQTGPTDVQWAPDGRHCRYLLGAARKLAGARAASLQWGPGERTPAMGAR